MNVLFLCLCAAHNIPAPEAEYRFHPERKWRFDWAWTKQRVALEKQGGIFSHGRHVRGRALMKEYEKLNAAAAAGWRVLFAAPEQIEDGSIFETLRQALAVTLEEVR